jgi:hypothetical protein
MLRCSSKMMNNDEILSIWAPDVLPWSRWAKPVLFAHLHAAMPPVPVPEMTCDVNWVPPSDGKTALVLDLPGAEGVLAGVALAVRGYRPVPLYNALPLPYGEQVIDQMTGRAVAAVDVLPIISALTKGAERLAQLKLPSDAPPSFLLDANRSGDGRKMKADEFDNRSISFTTDFPSAIFFASQGIERVILVQKDRIDPLPDLAHSLRRWQDAGFLLERKGVNSPELPESFQVARPPWYGAMFQRALSSIGLRRAAMAMGGFGAWMAESSSGG